MKKLICVLFSLTMLACSSNGTKVDGGLDGSTDTDLECHAVIPAAISTQAEAEFTVTGSGFLDGMTVSVTETTTSASVDLGAATLFASTDALVGVSEGAVPVGTYQMTLTNPGGGTAVCPTNFDALDVAPLTVTLVSPDSAWIGIDTDAIMSDKQVVIEGTGFEEVPMVTWVSTSDPSARYPTSIVVFASSTELEGICPSESDSMPAGMYWVEVANPSGLIAFWMDGSVKGEFEINTTPPPNIFEIDPFRNPASANFDMTVLGDYFQSGAQVQLLESDDTPIDLVTTFVSAGELTAEVDHNDVSQGIYRVRVVNPDNQYDIFYSYEATEAAIGHLGNFALIPDALVTARWRQSSVAGFDAFGGSYIYTTGGLDSGDSVLRDVEIMAISLTGEPGVPWVAQQWNGTTSSREDNLMGTSSSPTGRQGHSLVRAGKWIYAVGGADTNTNLPSMTTSALDTIERARILGLDTRPVIDTNTFNSSVGTLATGTWYYQVSAVTPSGETLASSLKMISGGSGTVTIQWSPVTGAISYNVYRNVDPTGNSGKTHLLAHGVTGASYSDDGSVTPDSTGIAPLPFGSISRWETLSTTLTVPREGLEALVITVPSGSATVDDVTYLFAVGGRPDASGTGYHVSGERAEILADGSLAAFSTLSNDLNHARAFHVLVTNMGQDLSGFIPDPDIPIEKSVPTGPLYLMAILGDDAHAGSGNDGRRDFEVTEIVTSDGDNSAWTVQTELLQIGHPTHGHGASLHFDVLFTFCAVTTEDIGSDPAVSPAAASRLLYAPSSPPPPPPADVLHSRTSNSSSFATPRGYYEIVRVNGYLWAIAGNDSTGPLASIERTLQ